MAYINRMGGVEDFEYTIDVRLHSSVRIYGNDTTDPPPNNTGWYGSMVGARFYHTFSTIRVEPFMYMDMSTSYRIYHMNGTLLKEIGGSSFAGTFKVRNPNMKELVNFTFQTNSSGEYIFRGVHGNLPYTHFDGI